MINKWNSEQNNKKMFFLNKKTSIFFLKKSSQKRLQLFKVSYKYPHRKEQKSPFLKRNQQKENKINVSTYEPNLVEFSRFCLAKPATAIQA